jgi:HAD superfamily hydrolase (TIGR01509 family)
MPRRMRSSIRNAQNSNPAAERLDFPAVLFDLDGTLIDSNYHHVIAWERALRAAQIVIPTWKIHRRIGMSGKSFLPELLRETGRGRKSIDVERLEKAHDNLFSGRIRELAPLPGADELLRHLSRHKIPIAIATTGGRSATTRLLRRLNVPSSMEIVTGDDVEKAKPSPDIFVTAARRLNVPIGDCIVVGDSAWDLLAAGRKSALGVGVLSGGYGQEELERAGAFRVYSDPADMLLHLEQLGLPGA